MRIRSPYVIALVLSLMFPPLAAAQVSGPETPTDTRHMVTFDLTAIGGTIGYAHRIGENRYLGFDGGVDVAVFSYMLYAGRHFSEANGWAYEDQDGFTGKDLFEIVNANIYIRHIYGNRWNIDTGVRGSLFLHYDSSDDDPGGGMFAGVYASVFYGWRHVKFGPRVQMGVFTEGSPEFGIFISPIIVRVAIPWE